MLTSNPQPTTHLQFDYARLLSHPHQTHIGHSCSLPAGALFQYSHIWTRVHSYAAWGVASCDPLSLSEMGSPWCSTSLNARTPTRLSGAHSCFALCKFFSSCFPVYLMQESIGNPAKDNVQHPYHATVYRGFLDALGALVLALTSPTVPTSYECWCDAGSTKCVIRSLQSCLFAL